MAVTSIIHTGHQAPTGLSPRSLQVHHKKGSRKQLKHSGGLNRHRFTPFSKQDRRAQQRMLAGRPDLTMEQLAPFTAKQAFAAFMAVNMEVMQQAKVPKDRLRYVELFTKHIHEKMAHQEAVLKSLKAIVIGAIKTEQRRVNTNVRKYFRKGAINRGLVTEEGFKREVLRGADNPLVRTRGAAERSIRDITDDLIDSAGAVDIDLDEPLQDTPSPRGRMPNTIIGFIYLICKIAYECLEGFISLFMPAPKRLK